jgi:hypothetical protein
VRRGLTRLGDRLALKLIYVPELDAMMSAEERDRILRDAQPNSWVTFANDESKLVGCGLTYSEAVEDAERNGELNPVLVKIRIVGNRGFLEFACNRQVIPFRNSGVPGQTRV